MVDWMIIEDLDTPLARGQANLVAARGARKRKFRFSGRARSVEEKT